MTSLGDLTTSTPPAATRATTPGWRDPRLWIGVLIVVLSVVAGSRLLAAADESVPVWAAVGDMAAGDEVGPEDLVARRVRFVDPADLSLYFAADRALPADLRLVQGVGGGELLARSATGTSQEAGVLQLPVTVPPGAVPPDVGAGSVVDVYLRSDGRCSGCAEAALAEVAVVTAPAADELTGDQQLVLAVSQEEADRWFGLLARLQAPTVTVLARG
ncbi:hypothetical protein [Nocardioides euryhalodurans]|uniref:SAF domain-containing protein n=1 Tax=Nocardioides euryhalodurans TaxID=2518370 RepID=A0A4P7GPJ4_9ACTN|nr:hypothetical protein [Nocardioides euryhalodurans]QBR93717.1 hypothetical protein EXE57_16635 [Nocardioides euryhalodurans]